MLVYTTGGGVTGFTLDPPVGEFFLSHRKIRMPDFGPTSISLPESNNTSGTARKRIPHHPDPILPGILDPWQQIFTGIC